MRRLIIGLLAAALLGAPDGWTAEIHDTARDGRLDRVIALLDADPALLEARDTRQATPLVWAADRGQLEVVRLLLDRGADLAARDVDGDTPLHVAAWSDRSAVIGLLLDRGAGIDVRNNGRRTPLAYSVQRGNLAAAQVLLARGAEREPFDDQQRTPLMTVAVETGNVAMARLLLDSGADVDLRNEFGQTPLQLAAWMGFRSLVGLFLDRGVSLPRDEAMGQALAERAAQRGLTRLLLALADHGVDLRAPHPGGGSLLHAAASGGAATIMSLLLARGLAVDQLDAFGWSPLHHAAARNRAAVVELLLARGADRDRLTPAGCSARELARQAGGEAVLAVLVRAGADTTTWRFPPRCGKYLGQEKPGATARLFAPDIVSTPFGSRQGSLVFSPDGMEAFWPMALTPPDSGYGSSTIMTSRQENGCWTPPRQAAFARAGDGAPACAPGGRRLFFVSRRPITPGGRPRGPRLWFCEQQGPGWSEPRPVEEVPGNPALSDQVSVAADGTLYFRAQDGVCRSRWSNGAYTAPERLDGPFADRALDAWAPLIAPDQRFLVFAWGGQGGAYGGLDLYVSFADGRGGWTRPRNLGGVVNTPADDTHPQLSSDGRGLFYSSSRDGCPGVYWVATETIDALRGP